MGQPQERQQKGRRKRKKDVQIVQSWEENRLLQCKDVTMATGLWDESELTIFH